MKSGLYTRTGDKGTTSLVGGERVKKNSIRLEAYGTIDELSSFLGAISADQTCTHEVAMHILMVQNQLFNIGCYLATAVKEGEEPKCNSITPEKMTDLEGWIDNLDEQTPKVNAFVLPGGCELAAKAHLARVVCRRAERRIFDLEEEAYVDPQVAAYINRLSDWLFIMARYFNFISDCQEIKWNQSL